MAAGVLLGSIATIVAVIAVASAGLLMLSGRIDLQRAIRVILGCFILFSGSSIAQGIINGMNAYSEQQAAPEAPMVYTPPTAADSQKPPRPDDPYAGAAVSPQVQAREIHLDGS